MKSKDEESAVRFNQGLVELKRCWAEVDETALECAIGFFRNATRLFSSNADYWVGLGFALDMKGESDAALDAMRRATELDPADEEAKVFVLTLLAEAFFETEALSGIEELATRTGMDLESLRHDLAAAKMPVDALNILKNGFLHPRNFIRSRLEDAMDRVERSYASLSSHAEDDLEDCHDHLAELEREFVLDRVPPTLHHLIPWVMRLGVGDDPCRAILAAELTQGERNEVLQDSRDYHSEVHTWLDSFGESALSAEAAAFMYTLLAIEEMDV